jgi:hypothetical protein
MNKSQQDRLKNLLRTAIPRLHHELEPARDLWPAVLRRLDETPEPSPGLLSRPIPWFDWVLAGGLAIFVVAFPATIPLLLYYL